MNREEFIKMMAGAKLFDLTQDCSIKTPPWPGDKSLEVHYFKRVTGALGGGQGANGQILNWSNTVGTHLVGERASTHVDAVSAISPSKTSAVPVSLPTSPI